MVEHPQLRQEQLEIATLGACQYKSPLVRSLRTGEGVGTYVPDDMRVLYEPCLQFGEQVNPLSFERAGAREHLFFDPAKTKAAIVSCGGLCPGINNVIRGLVLELTFNYGIGQILGIRYGYQGLNPNAGRPPVTLTTESVEGIQHRGGTILGSSRGHQDPKTTVQFLVDNEIDVLFCIGGDGTQRGAHAMADEIARRKLPIAIVGIPKTLDNDIKFCFRTFGFFSAVAEADLVIDRAHIEAKGVLNGIGLVKLMGRQAGFIAAAATLASGEANFTLVPEVPFELDGPHGFLTALQRRVQAREHAVIVVAEGAGHASMRPS